MADSVWFQINQILLGAAQHGSPDTWEVSWKGQGFPGRTEGMFLDLFNWLVLSVE